MEDTVSELLELARLDEAQGDEPDLVPEIDLDESCSRDCSPTPERRRDTRVGRTGARTP